MKKLMRAQDHWLVALAMLLLLQGMAHDAGQAEFHRIAGYYFPFFGLYLLCVFLPRHHTQERVRFWVVMAMVFRLTLLFSFPAWSDDIYRFVWDGRLVAQGHNPFARLPAGMLEGGLQVEGIDRGLFESFGSKNTYSCYPPVAQAQFFSGAWLFPGDIGGSVAVMKAWLVILEAGTLLLAMKLLERFGQPVSRVLIYALNPLILMEISGNVHFEGAMISFLMLSLVWLQAGGLSALLGSAVAFAMSVSSKLLPLMFLPVVTRHLGWRKGMVFSVLAGCATVLTFLPFADEAVLRGLVGSLGLYFNKLEFNGSVYYLLRWVGYRLWGYNQIAVLGPALGLLAGLLICWLSFHHRADRVFGGRSVEGDVPVVVERMLFAVVLYLFCSTTVHPWYVSLPLALSMFTSWRFPVLWSGLVVLTYVSYSHVPYREDLWMVALEYGLLWVFMVHEWRQRRRVAGEAVSKV